MERMWLIVVDGLQLSQAVFHSLIDPLPIVYTKLYGQYNLTHSIPRREDWRDRLNVGFCVPNGSLSSYLESE